VLRKIFERKREEVVGGWRRLHNEELHNLIKSPRVRQVGHLAHKQEMTNAYNILVEKPDGKRQLVRHRHRWENNIRMHFKETVSV
jgi:hypothetical protein